MPLKVIPPKEGRSSFYRVRGTHRGVHLDRTTGIEAGEKRALARAEAFRDKWREQIECGELTGKKPLTFGEAALAFAQHGGENRFLDPLIKHFGAKVAAQDIDQAMVDAAADKLYPHGAPATKRRQVHAPISAVLRHNGIPFVMKWPKGSQGNSREVWLREDEAARVIARATEIDAGLGAMMLLGLYTGMRLGEMLGLTWADVSLEEQTATVLRTKNGDPRVAFLPSMVCAALSNLYYAPCNQIAATRALKRLGLWQKGDPALPAEARPHPQARIFQFVRNGRLNDLAHDAYERAGVDPGDAPFHCLRHTYATWMTRLGADLIGAKVWRSQTSARRYTHFVVSEEARKAELLPGAGFSPDLAKNQMMEIG